MAVTQTVFRTISCNADGCDKTVTFEASKEKDVLQLPENVWVKSFRTIQTIDNRVFGYCSDACEITGATSGVHNIQEKRIISDAGNPAQVQMAAQAAKAAEEATKQLRAGKGIVAG